MNQMKNKIFGGIFMAIVALALASHVHAEGLFGLFGHDTHKASYQSHKGNEDTGTMASDDSIVGEVASVKNEALCKSQVLGGRGPEIVNAKLDRKTKMGCYDHFTIVHSGLTRTPLWSAEHLQKDTIIAAAKIKRKDSFHPETRIPADERAELSDYARSGYDRGHMAPNKDFPDKLSQWQCFTLANMIPQNPNNNQNLWEGIESATRTLAKKNGELYVITGPLFIGKTVESLKGRVMIPTNIYKAIYDPRSGRAAAYLVNNAAGMEYQVISIAELERMAGINLFPTLTDKIKNSPMDLPKPTPHSREH